MKRKLLKALVSILDWILNRYGYEVEFDVKKLNSFDVSENLLNLNIGAGDYVLKNFKSLDFYSKHYYGSKEEFLKNRVEYDIRSDDIPFKDNTVDNIYISHVIEHIETVYVKKLLSECFRVMKPGGVLRVACPDGKFLFNVSKFRNEYWSWRYRTFLDGPYTFAKEEDLRPFDFLIRELSTQKCRFYDNSLEDLILNEQSYEGLSYKALREQAVKNVRSDQITPGTI